MARVARVVTTQRAPTGAELENVKMKNEITCDMCALPVEDSAAACGATVCASCALEVVAERDADREHRCEFCGAEGVALGVMFCADCNAASVEAWGRAYNLPGAGVVAPTSEEIKVMIWRRDEVARRVTALDAIILGAAERARPAAVTAEEFVDGLRAPGAWLDALEAQGAAPAPAPAPAEEWITCPECEGSGEWQKDSWTALYGGYRCLECDGKGQIPARAPAPLAAAPLGAKLAALEEPLEGETWRAFHERAAAEIIGHYAGADGDEDTRAELREAVDHIVKAADEAAAERAAAAVARVEELLAAHHREIAQLIDAGKRGAVVEALKILNTATGAAAAALTRGPEDPAVD